MGEFECSYSRSVYTMDDEVGPWKRAFFNGPTFMIRLLKKSILNLGPLTKCKANVDQEEWPCTKKWMCIIFLIYAQKGHFWKKKVFSFSCLLLGFTCLRFLLNLLKMWLANLLTTIFTKNEQFNLYMFNVIYMWHVHCVVHWALFATCFTMCAQILEF